MSPSDVQLQEVTRLLTNTAAGPGTPNHAHVLCNGSGARVVLTSITTRACERATVTRARVSVQL